MISCACSGSLGGGVGGGGGSGMSLYTVKPCVIDTQLIRTTYVALSVSVLTEFDCTWYQ